jgi:hypothetical protein
MSEDQEIEAPKLLGAVGSLSLGARCDGVMRP